MTENDGPRFLTAFTGLCAYFDKPYSEILLDIYWRGLEELDIDQVESAFFSSIKTARFFPKIAEILESVDGGPEERAILAWEQLQEAVRRGGASESVLFVDSKITRTVELLGGWFQVCMWPIAELQFRRHEFLQTYKALKSGGSPRSLAGVIERENSARGYLNHVPDPLVIGNRQKLLGQAQKGQSLAISGAIGKVVRALSVEDAERSEVPN